jgi:hypothetical protein
MQMLWKSSFVVVGGLVIVDVNCQKCWWGWCPELGLPGIAQLAGR